MTHAGLSSDAVGRRMALAREWEDLIAQVRALDGFEDFLKPPRLRDLLPAAERGPVVIVNVSRWRCDALIVRRDGVTPHELPGLTLDEAVARADAYLSALSSAEAADLRRLAAQEAQAGETPRDVARRRLAASRDLEEAHRQVDEMLAGLQGWMWDTIAEPVLDALGYTEAPAGDEAKWPRIWWCPTGPLTILPLHTAGRARRSRRRPRRARPRDLLVHADTAGAAGKPPLRQRARPCRRGHRPAAIRRRARPAGPGADRQLR